MDEKGSCINDVSGIEITHREDSCLPMDHTDMDVETNIIETEESNKLNTKDNINVECNVKDYTDPVCDVPHVKGCEVEGDAKGQMFVVSSYEEMKEVIQEYSTRTACHFVVSRKAKSFGLPSLECNLSGHQVQWHDMRRNGTITNIIPFDGIPHICVGDYQMNCEFGIDNHASKKEKRRKLKADGKLNVRSRILKNPTKKCGCPVKIYAKQIIKFPEFKINDNTEWKRKEGARKLRQKIKECRKDLKSEVVIIGKLPDISDHKFHEILKGRYLSKEVIHPDLILKTQELFFQRKSNVQILEELKKYVSNNMFWKQELPDPNSRKYYPGISDIRNIVFRVQQRCAVSEEESGNIQQMIKKIQTENEYVKIQFQVNQKKLNELKVNSSDEFVESDADEDGNRKKDKKSQVLLFCYQTPMQQRLMKRYSNISFIVEISEHKSSRKILTYKIYAVLVQTNVDYQVIGCIIVSKLKEEGLIDGLNLFREWNPSWNPKYFFVDCSQVIYDAVTSSFPECSYYLNAYSCERKWSEFVNAPSNDLEGHSDEILSYLRNMQYSFTEDSLTFSASLLEKYEVWRENENLRIWFQDTWLQLAKRWVFGYRPEDLLITQHLKSSIDDCIHVYQDALNQSGKTNGLMEIIEKVTHNISNDEYDNYVKRNQEHYWWYQEFRKNNYFTESMQGVPTAIISYVDGISKLAELNNFTIVLDPSGVFTVQLDALDESIEDVVQDEYNSGIPINEIEIMETAFGSIEYSSKLEPGNYTVSFGDSYSYPFCTCSHWLFYRLPCIHMFAVFNKVPGWRYDMLSPLYRCNPTLDIDFSCLNYSIHSTICDRGCQTCVSEDSFNFEIDSSNQEIFECPETISVTELLLEQTGQFLKYFKKMEFLFKKKTFYINMLDQLKEIVIKLQNCFMDNNIMNEKQEKQVHITSNLNTVNTAAFISSAKSNNLTNVPDIKKGANILAETLKTRNEPTNDFCMQLSKCDSIETVISKDSLHGILKDRKLPYSCVSKTSSNKEPAEKIIDNLKHILASMKPVEGASCGILQCNKISMVSNKEPAEKILDHPKHNLVSMEPFEGTSSGILQYDETDELGKSMVEKITSLQSFATSLVDSKKEKTKLPPSSIKNLSFTEKLPFRRNSRSAAILPAPLSHKGNVNVSAVKRKMDLSPLQKYDVYSPGSISNEGKINEINLDTNICSRSSDTDSCFLEPTKKNKPTSDVISLKKNDNG